MFERSRFLRLSEWLSRHFGKRSWVNGRFIKLLDCERSWRYYIFPEIEWEEVTEIEVFWFGFIVHWKNDMWNHHFPGFGMLAKQFTFKHPIRHQENRIGE